MLSFHFGLQNIRPVRLADIGKLMRGLHRVGGQVRQIPPHVHQPLIGENAVKHHARMVKDAQPLRLSRGFRLLHNQFRHPAGGAQFASSYNRLADKSALLAAAGVASANFIAVIAYGWVGIKAGLPRQPGGDANVGLRLGHGRVARQSHALYVLETKGRLGRIRKRGRVWRGHDLQVVEG